jgi:hypothetical protein
METCYKNWSGSILSYLWSLICELYLSTLPIQSHESVFYVLVKDKGGHKVVWLLHKRLIWRTLIVWFWILTNIIASFTESFGITGDSGPVQFHSSTSWRPGRCVLPSTNLKLHRLIRHEFFFLLTTVTFLNQHLRTLWESSVCFTHHALYFFCPLKEDH